LGGGASWCERLEGGNEGLMLFGYIVTFSGVLVQWQEALCPSKHHYNVYKF
jgi:hypothetical protein